VTVRSAQVVILAGGLGTRLRPVTTQIPKPMVPVAGVPYLEHQLRLLAEQGLADVVLLTGYLGEQIEECFGDGSRLGLQLRYSREPTPLGTGGALREARSLLASEFLVIYGDSYLPIEYSAVVDRLRATNGSGVVVLYHDPSGETDVPGNVAIDGNDYVVRYDKSGTKDPELRYIEAGVLALRKSVLDLMPATGVVSLEQEIFPQLIAQRGLVGLPTTQRFYDIGTPDRLRAIEALLR
jgi:NDP-sugar pyrophosphorylase family protein